MALQDKLDAFRAEFEAKAPAHALTVMHQTTESLIASGQVQRALRVGDRAPDFQLPDPDGTLVTLTELLARGPLVLTFYRGVWCPYCNIELQALEAVAASLRAEGASIVAVSPQSPANSRKSQRDSSLSYPILSDHGGALAEAFGIRWALPTDLQAIHKQFGADLTVFNGESSWTLPMPARYVIGSDGVIAYAEINPDYTRRPDPSELLPVLKSLRAGQPA